MSYNVLQALKFGLEGGEFSANVSKASRYFIADWVVLRAKQDIPPQTEVTISYIDACADYSLQASWLESLGIPDTALKERARRWAETSDPELLAVQRCLSSGQSEIGSCVGGPLEEKKRFLHQIGAETGLIWCWGQLVQWLRGLKAAAQNAGETAAALGAALAAAELLSRHLVPRGLVIGVELVPGMQVGTRQVKGWQGCFEAGIRQILQQHSSAGNSACFGDIVDACQFRRGLGCTLGAVGSLL